MGSINISKPLSTFLKPAPLINLSNIKSNFWECQESNLALWEARILPLSYAAPTTCHVYNTGHLTGCPLRRTVIDEELQRSSEAAEAWLEHPVSILFCAKKGTRKNFPPLWQKLFHFIWQTFLRTSLADRLIKTWVGIKLLVLAQFIVFLSDLLDCISQLYKRLDRSISS